MEESSQSSFGEMLKTYRKQRGLTQRQLARKLAMHHNTVGAWERGDYLPATRGLILELARCLRLSEAETQHLLEAGLTTVASLWNVPYQRNPFFTGRQEILQQIHTILTREQNVSSTRSCALSGLVGMGKTQTAIEYAYQHALDYTAVFWIHAETEESIIGSFIAMATTLKLPLHHLQTQEQVITIVCSWLTSRYNWLMIFDNVKHVELVKRFLPASRDGSLLFTTLRPTLGSLAPCLELPPLLLEESVQLLLLRASSQVPYGTVMAAHTNEVTSVRELAIALGGLPLALEQAAACVEELHCSFSRFLHLFQQDAIQMLQKHPSSVLYPHSVARAFTLVFEQLQQSNPVAGDLLIMCCFLAPDKIPEELLIQSRLDLGLELQSVLSNPFQFNVAFKDILAYALLHRNTRDETVSVHRIVQIVLKEKLSEMDQRAWIERLIRMLNQLFLFEQSQLDMSHWTWYEHVMPHAQVVLQQAEHKRLFSPELGSLLNKIALYLFRRARYEQAEALYLRAISVQERRLEMGYPDLVLALVGLTSTYYQQGKYQEVEIFYQRALSLGEEHLEPKHLRSLAWVAYKQERYAEAEALIERALSFYKYVPLSDQHDLATIVHLKANIYRTQGRYEDATLLYQHALSLYWPALESGTIDIALFMSDFAKLYLYQARWEKAGQLYQEALRFWERFQELNHLDHADCLESYAQLLRRQQEEQEADLHIKRAQEIRARHLATRSISLGEIPLSVASEDVRDLTLFAERDEDDLFETFLQQCCVLSTQFTCRAVDLWQTYQKWVRTQENTLRLSRQAFSFKLKMKGCSQARTNAHRIWCGIELNAGQKSDEYKLQTHVSSHTMRY